jgi:hypothetical protein
MSNRSFIFAAAIAAALGGAALVPSAASAVTVHVPSVQVHISLPKGGGATTVTDRRFLNPQRLPPGSKVFLNPQPLPP